MEQTALLNAKDDALFGTVQVALKAPDRRWPEQAMGISGVSAATSAMKAVRIR